MQRKVHFISDKYLVELEKKVNNFIKKIGCVNVNIAFNSFANSYIAIIIYDEICW